MRTAFLVLTVMLLAVFNPARSQTVPNSPKDLSDALKAVKSPDPVERTAGLSFLALLGGDAKVGSRDVVNLLYDTNKDVSDWAKLALPKVNPPLAGPVFTLLNSKDEEARLQAIAELAKMKGAAAPAIPALMRQLKNEGGDKVAAIQALGAVGAKDPALSTTLINLALKDPDPKVRAAAYQALPNMEDKTGAVTVVTGMLKNTDPAQRSTALNGLGHFAKGNPMLIQIIRNSLEDPSPTVRETAKAVLAKVTQPAK